MLRRTALLGLTSVPFLFASGCAVRSRSTSPPSIEEAFVYIFPLYEFARTAVARSGPRGGGINRSMNLLIRGVLRNPVILTSSLSTQKLLPTTF